MNYHDQIDADQRTMWIIERIVAVARAQPDEVAVVKGSERLTYGELDSFSSKLANEMVSRRVGTGDLVGIAIERSLNLIVAIVAVLKTGAAYVAIDPEYPEERVAQMCSAVPLAMILTTQGGLGTRPPFGAPRLLLDLDRALIEAHSADFAIPPLAANDLVYVVYTSGSTGVPKATAVHQEGWANLMAWFVSEFALNATDRNLIISSFSFDITQRSIVLPLLVGGQLHLLDGYAIDCELIHSTIESQGITLMNCAPSAFYPVVEKVSDFTCLKSLRWLFLGGEAINAARIRAWADASSTRTIVVNVYGAAECSDVSSFYALRKYQRYATEGVPAGRPIFKTTITLVNEAGEPVPAGEIGEIVISGAGVGKGYINDPELTMKRFIPDPFGGSGTAYLTGDLGRWVDKDCLIFVGRTDSQVKIRGNRVDLGDVESLLRQDVRVRDAVAAKRTLSDGSDVLVAFILTEPSTPITELFVADIRKAMGRRAPPFMVPSLIDVLDAFPLNPNGKVDRAMIATRPIMGNSTATYHYALAPHEQVIADIFKKILNVDVIARDDNFFDMGGYSALVTEALSEINYRFDSAITIYDFLTGPSVAALSARFEATTAT